MNAKPTLDDAFVLYVADLQRRKRKTIKSIEAFYCNNIHNDLGHKKITSIKYKDVERLFDKMTDDGTPAKANRLLKTLSAIYNLAIVKAKKGEFGKKIAITNICFGIEKNREIKRKRYYNEQELSRIFAVLRAREANRYNNASSIAAIKLLIYTGARKGEILNANWSDLHGDTLVLKEHKTDDRDDSRVIRLNDQAMAVINGLERKGTKIINTRYIDRFWQSVAKEAGCPDIHIHDLRHSFATFAFRSKKMSIEEVGNLLGHKSTQSTMRYTHITDDTASQNAKVAGNEIFNSINVLSAAHRGADR